MKISQIKTASRVDELSGEFGLVAVVYANNGGPGSSQLLPLFQYFRHYNLIKLKVDDVAFIFKQTDLEIAAGEIEPGASSKIARRD